MTEETPDYAPSDAIESAGKVHHFNGIKLEPFSFGRQVAAQRLQMNGDSPLEASAMLIFLCTLPAERIDRARGEAETRAFRMELNEWSDKQGIGLQSAPAKECIRIANEIWSEIIASSAEPITHGPKKKTRKSKGSSAV